MIDKPRKTSRATGGHLVPMSVRGRHDFLAAALPPLRPAFFFWAVVPP
jgi:hypothetical protein